MINKKIAIQSVLDRMDQAAKNSEEDTKTITLVAVSKTKPIEDIIAAYEAGVRHFGENRAKELAEKAQALRHLKGIKWHFIGHLQSKQSKGVAEYAHYFHAVDRIKIAKRLSMQRSQEKRDLKVFLQVNISGESSKGGFLCDHWQDNQTQWNTLLDAVKIIANLPYIKIHGLMTMAPWGESKDKIQAIFASLRQLSQQLNIVLPTLEAHELSMGMSADFESAVEEGATYVRVGSAIFGSRDYCSLS